MHHGRLLDVLEKFLYSDFVERMGMGTETMTFQCVFIRSLQIASYHSSAKNSDCSTIFHANDFYKGPDMSGNRPNGLKWTYSYQVRIRLLPK